MKRIKLWFVLIIVISTSCKEIQIVGEQNIDFNKDSPDWGRKKTGLSRFESSILPNVFLHHKLQISDKEAIEISKQWSQIIDFFNENFSTEDTSLFTKDGEFSLDQLIFYIGDSPENRSMLKVAHPDLIFLDKSVLTKPSLIILEILKELGDDLPDLASQQWLYEKSVLQLYENLIYHKKSNKLPYYSIIYNADFLSISDELFLEVFEARAELDGQKIDLKSFNKNLIHLINLVSISKISLYSHDDSEQKEYHVSRVRIFLEKLKLNKDVELNDFELLGTFTFLWDIHHKLHYQKFIKEIEGHTIFSYNNVNFFVPNDLASIKIKWLEGFVNGVIIPRTNIDIDRDKALNVVLIESESKFTSPGYLSNQIMITVDNSLLEIRDKEKFIDQLWGWKIKDLIDSENKFNFTSSFREAYSLLPEFSENSIIEMNFEELKASYSTFLTLLYSDKDIESSINSIDELIEYRKTDVLSEICKSPSEEELKFFLMKYNFRNFELTSTIDFMIYLKDFLHFKHLLTTARIFKLSSDKSTTFNFVKSALHFYLITSRMQVEDPIFIQYATLFFKPFDDYRNKMVTFFGDSKTKYKYILNHYDIGISGSSYSTPASPCPRFIIKNRVPTICFNIEPGQALQDLLLVSYPHELSFFQLVLQLNPQVTSSLFTNDRYRNLKEPFRNFVELEADLFLGFYQAHPNGLNLSNEEIRKVINQLSQKPRESMDYFKYSPYSFGEVKQRKRAYLLGANLAKLSKWNSSSPKDVILKLHEKFIKIYRKSNLLKASELNPEVANLFSEETFD